MDDWLTAKAAKLAAHSGTAETRLFLSPYDIQALVDLARLATDTSGDVTNAPALCYLLGFAVGNTGRDLHSLADALQT